MVALRHRAFKTGEMLTHTTCSTTASRFTMHAHAMCINRAVCSASALHLRYAQAHRALCSASALRLRYTQAQRAAFACFEMTINGHVTSDYSRAERQQPQCALLHCGLAHGSVRGPRLADFMTRARDMCAQVRTRSESLIVQARRLGETGL